MRYINEAEVVNGLVFKKNMDELLTDKAFAKLFDLPENFDKMVGDLNTFFKGTVLTKNALETFLTVSKLLVVISAIALKPSLYYWSLQFLNKFEVDLM
jgi:hypothetical protein